MGKKEFCNPAYLHSVPTKLFVHFLLWGKMFLFTAVGTVTVFCATSGMCTGRTVHGPLRITSTQPSIISMNSDGFFPISEHRYGKVSQHKK